MSGPVTLADQVFCLRRELRLRNRAYPRWVATGKMTAVEAEREIGRMSAALATLESLLAKEPPITLFPTDESTDP